MMLGFDTRRKFFDALKHGRKLATQSFNIELSMAIPDLIKGLRIANASMKENGQVEENEADAMPMPHLNTCARVLLLRGMHFGGLCPCSSGI